MNLNNVDQAEVAEDDDKYELHDMPVKLLELSAASYKDRSKRRMSLPISGLSASSRKSSIASSDGNSGITPDKSGGIKAERRGSGRRDSTFSCGSWSDSYTEYDSDDGVGAGCSPRDREQKTSEGFTDFCVRNVGLSKFGRHEIEFAENEMEGLMKLRDKVSVP